MESNGLISELAKLGLKQPGSVRYNLSRAEAIEEAVKNDEGVFSASGAFVVNTSPYTGRSPNDKYLVHNGDADLWFASGTREIDVEAYRS